VVLTVGELGFVSSGVALLAISGTLAGVRLTNKGNIEAAKLTNQTTLDSVKLANDNALALAREERSSKHSDELIALKRTVYADCITKLGQLMNLQLRRASMSSDSDGFVEIIKEAANATLSAVSAVTVVQMIADEPVNSLVVMALNSGMENGELAKMPRIMNMLDTAMRQDVRSEKPSSLEELNRQYPETE
jgi:hypothetical protein